LFPFALIFKTFSYFGFLAMQCRCFRTKSLEISFETIMLCCRYRASSLIIDLRLGLLRTGFYFCFIFSCHGREPHWCLSLYLKNFRLGE